MSFFSRFIIRWAWIIALVGTLLAGAGAYYSVQLYKNLRPDLEELLPNNARSVIDLNEVTQRLESIDNLAVLVFSKHPVESRRFVTDLAEALKKAPKSVISSVEYRIDRELKFFEARRPLYMEVSDLVRIRNYIDDRIQYEKKLYNPLNIFSEVELPEPMLDFMGMERKYSQKSSAYSRFPSGFYATPDELIRVILVNMPGKSSGMANIHGIKDYVVETVARLNPKSYAQDIELKYTGGVQNTIEEQAALIADLELSTAIVAILVTLAMWAFFRAARATLALVASLLMGTLWTFGIAYFAVGYLNANSAFLGSIVIGNGINFGIIYLARYLEERRKGNNSLRGIHLSNRHTATATWTAALAAGLSYGSLSLTGFRGFRQFGVIGLIGMVLCWISAYTLLPAFLTLLEKSGPLAKRKERKGDNAFAARAARFIQRWAWVICGLSFAATFVSVNMFSRLSPDILEADLSKLRNKESMAHGSGYLSRFVDEIFQRYLTPIVILPKNPANTLKIAQILREKMRTQGSQGMIANVQTIDDFIPKDQLKKIKILREIRNLLPPKLFKRLAPADQKKIKSLLTPEAFIPIAMKDLPELVLVKFQEKDGSIGKLVLVEPPLSDLTLQRDSIIRFIRELRETADSVEPGTAVAGTLPISADMLEAISRDGPKATLFAFSAVVLLVIILFRNVKTVSLVLFALILGVTWLGGVILGMGVKINFLNFIALPITFGIGVDYGVNIFQRYREAGTESIMPVVRDTGPAVALCSFTTIVGYGSLLIAENQAFVSFGLLAVLGELTCIVAAVMALPAFLILISKRKRPV